MLNKADVVKFRDEVLQRTSVANSNKALKYLRVALNAGYKDGVAHYNPAAKVDVIRRRQAEVIERRPFTIPELKRSCPTPPTSGKGSFCLASTRASDSRTLPA